MFQRWFSKKQKPLTGAPALRRMKTHSAESGYVYQYFYEGQRPADEGGGVEFVFSLSADRKAWHPVTVALVGAALRAWEEAHGRGLSSTERYAVAKMALLQALDERPAPADMKGAVWVRAADVEGIAETLGL